MSASMFVGRVGGLAAALGFGVVVGGIGLAVATAAPEDSSASSARAGSAASTSTHAGIGGSNRTLSRHSLSCW